MAIFGTVGKKSWQEHLKIIKEKIMNANAHSRETAVKKSQFSEFEREWLRNEDFRREAGVEKATDETGEEVFWISNSKIGVAGRELP